MSIRIISERLLPTNVVAKRLAVSERTVRWYAATGQLRGIRDGHKLKLWKFYGSDVDDFKQANRRRTEGVDDDCQ